MPFCLLHPQPRAFRHPVPPHILRNLDQDNQNASGRSRTAPEFSSNRGPGGARASTRTARVARGVPRSRITWGMFKWVPRA